MQNKIVSNKILHRKKSTKNRDHRKLNGAHISVSLTDQSKIKKLQNLI